MEKKTVESKKTEEVDTKHKKVSCKTDKVSTKAGAKASTKASTKAGAKTSTKAGAKASAEASTKKSPKASAKAKDPIKKVVAKTKTALKSTTKSKAKSTEQELNSWIECAVDAIREKKGERIVSLDLRKIVGSSFDIFIVCEALSGTQVRAIADGVDEMMYKKLGLDALHKEGFDNAEWILLDYGQLVVHVFLRDMRVHYRLEELWGDAEIKVYED